MSLLALLQHGSGSAFQAGADTTAIAATSVAGGGTTAWGAWVELHSSLPIDVNRVDFIAFHEQGSSSNPVYEIGIGAAGSETPIEDSKVCIGRKQIADGGETITRYINLKKGDRVSVRVLTGSTSSTLCQVIFSNERGASSMQYRRLYTTSESTLGDYWPVIDPGTVAGTPGAWHEIEASTPFDVTEVVLHSGGYAGYRGDGTNRKIYLCDIGVGTSGSEVVKVSDIVLDYVDLYAMGFAPLSIPVPVSIPKGSRIAVRLTPNSGAVASAAPQTRMGFEIRGR